MKTSVVEMFDRLPPMAQREAIDFVEFLVEKQRRLASIVRKTPGVCGGLACIRNTRIPVWLLVSLHRAGADEAELLENYPALSPPDLEAAWIYQRDNLEEIEQAIAAQDDV